MTRVRFSDVVHAGHRHRGAAREPSGRGRQERRGHRRGRQDARGHRRGVRGQDGADARQVRGEVRGRQRVRADRAVRGQHHRRPGRLLQEQLRGHRDQSNEVRHSDIQIYYNKLSSPRII